MQREIRFRAWDIPHKEMVEVREITFSVGDISEINTSTYVWYGENLNSVKLLQFTGLYDKDKNAIYEGDVVCMYDGALAEIKWFERAVWMVGFVADEFKKGRERVIDTADLKNFPREMRRSKVIGNIYENPELLS